MNPLFNATLLQVAAPGPLADNGDPGQPVLRWEGRVRGYLKRARSQAVSQGESVVRRSDTFTLLASQGAPVIERAGGDWEAHTLVILDERGEPVKLRFVVRGMENRAVGGPLDSLRMILEHEQAAA